MLKYIELCMDVVASVGEAGWTGRIRPEQGASTAPLPEVQTARLLLSPYQLARTSADQCPRHFI